ncbi:MAG: hypothetical protein OJF49_002956 [Ktedonobacterales bacterium]|jgi:uncharacterized alkaline shock family protein YloU|nr:MAG: hypothetical protein OJF49_002956 [Ktedonobacterales bacterium]
MATGANGASDLAAPPRSFYATRTSDDLEREAVAEQLGTVRIARRVLRTVVEQAALHVDGVARMTTLRDDWPRMLGRPLPQHGVGLALRGDVVTIDLYVVIRPGANMVTVGAAVQEAVAAAVEHILGMSAGDVNVFIQDVA